MSVSEKPTGSGPAPRVFVDYEPRAHYNPTPRSAFRTNLSPPDPFLNMPALLSAFQLSLRAVAVVALLCVCANAGGDEREDFFERQIRPLLIDNCVKCHGAEKQEGGIRLDSRRQVLQGTPEIDALVNAKDVKASRLLQVLLHSEDDVQMPPKNKLSDQHIGDVRHWIATGAIWPENQDFGKAGAVEKNAWRRHWAFQPIADPPMPAAYQDGWHPIDAFIRQTLNDRNIQPSPPADGRTLVRRLSFAVNGLPPKLEDLQAASGITDRTALNDWLNDYTDRLLAVPQFGERWARYWLDISRYADTKGYVFTEDREYKDAWRFREWVIRSLNDDMPYDEFLRRQIAADRLPGADDPAQLAAMGFFTLGRRFLNNQHDIIDDRIDVLTRGTMGLTVTCARCHDHKFDPIPTADYYSLYGVFNSSHEPKNDPSPLRLVDHDKPREPVIFIRGSAGNRGDRVSRHFLTALSAGEPQAFTDGSGRLELAKKIASAENPLTARVAVNRVWLRLFGRGLVDSPSDFGVRTSPPSHPELLDHLATYFIKNNWSRKALIRYIVLSFTWRQSSQPRSDVADLDPENRLLARMSRRRLDFEAYRDSVLSVAGQLDQHVGGPSVDILSEPFTNRRTVYARIDRQNLPGTFRTFDFASPDNHAAQRFETTVPQQALFQLNSPFVIQQAQHVVDQADAEVRLENSVIVPNLYTRILQRQPSSDELTAAIQFLTASSDLLPGGNSGVGWQYGWGETNPEKTSVERFEPFREFHDDRWSAGATVPDPQFGYCMLTRDGGHPGRSLQHCAIRRWVADQNCSVRVKGRLQHPNANGDGVSGHVIVGSRSWASVHVHNQSANVDTEAIELKAGDVIDFVADCGTNDSHDSFRWQIDIQQTINGQQVHTWQSQKQFSGAPPSVRLSPLTQLAQALIMTNEFMFVD